MGPTLQARMAHEGRGERIAASEWRVDAAELRQPWGACDAHSVGFRQRPSQIAERSVALRAERYMSTGDEAQRLALAFAKIEAN